MKKNYKKWTLEEDKVLWEQVIANPKSNIEAFRKTSEILNRSLSSVSGRYYCAEFKRTVATLNQNKHRSFWQKVKDFFGL